MDLKNNDTVEKLFSAFHQLRKVKFSPPVLDGLTHGEMILLFHINRLYEDEKQSVKISELSKYMKVASPTITQQINNLEENGYVIRKMDKRDRRVVRVEVTEKGEAIMKRAGEKFHEFFEGLVEYLGEEDSVKFAELLLKASDYVNERLKK